MIGSIIGDIAGAVKSGLLRGEADDGHDEEHGQDADRRDNGPRGVGERCRSRRVAFEGG